MRPLSAETGGFCKWVWEVTNHLTRMRCVSSTRNRRTGGLVAVVEGRQTCRLPLMIAKQRLLATVVNCGTCRCPRKGRGASLHRTCPCVSGLQSCACCTNSFAHRSCHSRSLSTLKPWKTVCVHPTHSFRRIVMRAPGIPKTPSKSSVDWYGQTPLIVNRPPGSKPLQLPTCNLPKNLPH